MTDWWSNDPIASSPQAKAGGDWWSKDPRIGADGKVKQAEEPVVPVDPQLADDVHTALDPVGSKVRKDVDKAYAAGMPKYGVGRQVLQGMTLNGADEALALLNTPVQMVRQGIGPREAYDYAKQREDALLEDARAAAPVSSAAGNIVGGVVTGGNLMQAGATAIPAMTARLGRVLGTAAGGAVDGAALGAVSGFADGQDGERLERAAHDGAIGGAVGGVLPLAVAAAAPVVAPIASNISARVNPTGYAQRQVARAAERSGQTAEEIADRLGQASAEGQGEYRLLDALDYPGARLGAVVAKNPGEGRTQLREFLNQRQEGQGYRIGNALAEGLDAPQTAQATTARMTRDRTAMDNEAFGAARRDAGSVDVAPVVSLIDDTLRPAGHLTDPNGIAYDSVEGVLARARNLLTDGEQSISDFSVVQRARNDIADAVEVARRQGRGNQARLMRDVRNELDRRLQEASPSYRAALDDSAAAAREIDAVDLGSQSAGRGRSEDKIRAFEALTPDEQAAFRTGYADPLIAKAQNGAEGANKARPFTSLAMQTELPAIAAEGRGDTLMRQLGRENEMFANRAEALGNSKTAENLADNADTAIDPGLITNLLGGNFLGATRDLLRRGAASLNGNTEAVRAEMARLLMEGDRNRALTMLLRLGQADAQRGNLALGAHRGLLSGGLPALNSALDAPRRRPTAQAARTHR